MKKIKVLFRHRSMEMGGVEKVLLSMLNNLDRNKFDISLCLNLFQGELRNHIPKFIPYKTLAGGKEDFPKNKILNKIFLISRAIKLALYRKFPWFVDRFILHNDADIEIATGYTMFSDVLNSSNKKSKKIGWFHSDISYPKLQPIVPQLLKQIEMFDFFIFGSEQTKDILIKTYPNIKLPNHKVILNAIPIKEIKTKSEEFAPNIDSQYPIFTTVGRMHSRKGHHKLLEAHCKLIKEGFIHKVIVIGDGEERKNIENLIKEKKIENSFFLLGTIKNPYPYIKNSDFFIMPSESEGWPLVIADALILKKPIIATNVGGIPEMITHEETGYLINYNTQEIYSAMKEFLTNKSLISNIEKNLEHSETMFNNDKIFRSVEQIIINLSKS